MGSRIFRVSRERGSGGNSDNPLGGFGVASVGRTSFVVRCTAFGRIAYDISDSYRGEG